MKNIQIPEELFIALVKYHLLDVKEAEPEIKSGLMDKMDSISMRLLYSKYKTAPTEEEKQKARKEYLDKRGVPNNSRWWFFLMIITRAWHAPVKSTEGELLNVKSKMYWEIGMVRLASVVEKVARKRADKVGVYAQDKEQCHNRL